MKKQIVIAVELIAIIGLVWFTTIQPNSLPQILQPVVVPHYGANSDLGLAIARQIFGVVYLVLFAVLSLLASLVCSVDRLFIHKP